MRFLLGFLTAGVLTVLAPVVGVASATNVYIAQAAAGSADGSSCANADGVTFFNSSGNWGSGAGQIGPGTIVNLCGTITNPLQISGSGTSGNVIEVLWTPGARVSVPHGQIINLNGSYGYLLFDGGAACGPPTSCDAVEAASQTGYATGQTGIIEATANGSTLANQDVSTQAFYGCNNCHDIEIRNLIVRNLYVHSSLSDSTSSADTGPFIFQCSESNSGCASGTISIHDSVVHDTGNAISLEKTSSVTFNVYNIDFYHNNWAMEDSGDGTRTVSFHDNHIHDTSNWDTTSDAFHHNGVHFYTNTQSDSAGTSFYNNLSDGNWGSCCATSTGYYQELQGPNNFYVFNNVAIQYPGNTAPWLLGGGNPVLYANNTAIGVAATANNVEAVLAASLGSGVFENNAIETYGQYIIVYGPAPPATIDYNVYGKIGLNGNAPWAYGSASATTFLAWQSACSCDSHSSNPASLGVNSSGVARSGSTLINAGVNLTSLGIAALNNSTSAGDTVTPVPRPSSGPWDVGAYQHSTAVNPPTALIVAKQQ